MADLDDFFAKKDRKRNKQAKKLAQADEPKKPDEPRREKPAEDQQQPPANQQDEDEWREAEVAKKADYSGLKIQHLAPGQENSAGNEGTNGTTVNMSSEQKTKGPWNKVQQEPVEVPKVEEKGPPNPSEVVIPPPPAPKVYVPPLLRNRPPGSSMDGPQRVNRFGKPQAPDINNEEYFPVLGESRKGGHHHGGPGGGQWSEARSGAPPSSRMPPPQVSIGNRFTSLTHDS